jgi:WD40 repeat protein
VQRGNDDGGPVLAFDPSGALLASFEDSRLVIWDVATGEARARINAIGAPRSLAFSPDGKLLAIAVDYAVEMLDLATAATALPIACKSPYDESVWTPDGQTLVMTCMDEVRVWNRDATFERFAMRVRKTGVQGEHHTTVSPDGTRVAYASDPTTVQVRSLADGHLLATLVAGAPDKRNIDSIGDISWRPDGNAVAIVYKDDLETYDAASWAPGPRRHAFLTESAAYSPAGDQIAVSDEKGISLWRPATNEVEPVWPRAAPRLRWQGPGMLVADRLVLRGPPWHVDAATDGQRLSGATFAWTLDNTRLAQTIHGGIRVWDVAAGVERLALPEALEPPRVIDRFGPLAVFTGKPRIALDLRTGATSVVPAWFVLSPDGTRALNKTGRTTWQISDVMSGRVLVTADLKREVGLAWSGDGAFVFGYAQDSDNEPRLRWWRAKDLAPQQPMELGDARSWQPTVALPGTSLVVQGPGREVVDLATRQAALIKGLPLDTRDDDNMKVVVAPSGKRIAIDGHIVDIDAAALVTVGTFEASPDAYQVVAFRPRHEDQVLTAADDGRSFKIWDLRGKTALLTFAGTDLGGQPELDPTGERLLLRTGDDGPMVITSLADGKVVGELSDRAYTHWLGRRCYERTNGDSLHLADVDSGATLDIEHVDDKPTGFVAVRSDGAWQAGPSAVGKVKLRSAPSIRDGTMTATSAPPVSKLDLVAAFYAACQ